MNTVVLKHYPVENLPEEMVSDLTPPASGTVTVTIVAEPEMDKQTKEAMRRRLRALIGKPAGPSVNTLEGLRALRDEWD